MTRPCGKKGGLTLGRSPLSLAHPFTLMVWVKDLSPLRLTHHLMTPLCFASLRYGALFKTMHVNSDKTTEAWRIPSGSLVELGIVVHI